jgi:ankyrin repeat protein
LADVNATGKDGCTALHDAAFWSRSYPARELGKLLVSRGLALDVNSTNNIGLTPLHLAVMHESDDGLNLDFVRFLLCESSADVNAVGGLFGRTALHFAAIHKHRFSDWTVDMVVKLLICHGASLDAKDLKQQTVRDLANEYWLARVLDELEKTPKDEAVGFHERTGYCCRT